MTPLLAIKDLRVTTPGRRALIAETSISLGAGERLAIIGPSGAGKTTLLRAVLDDLPDGFQSTGTILLAGKAHQPGESDTRKRIADTIAYLPQDAGASLTPTMRIRSLLREAVHSTEADPDGTIREVLQAVQLPFDAAFLRRRPWQLSGGQQRRVALSRALARQCPILVLDEPTAGLDPETRRHVLGLLAHLSEHLRCALLLVTHDLAAADALHCRRHHLAEPPRPPHPDPDRRRLQRERPKIPALALREATITHPGGGIVLTQESLDLFPCEVTVLKGVSGTGKTTIARALVGLDALRAGHTELRGTALARGLRNRSSAQRRAVQLVGQSSHDAFNPRRTISQALRDAHPVVDPAAFLRTMGLDRDLLDRYPHQLSGGQRQRLALLRAISTCPDVLVLDEPTSALDPHTALRVLSLIRKIADEGTAVLLITHEDTLDPEQIDHTLTLTQHQPQPAAAPMRPETR